LSFGDRRLARAQPITVLLRFVTKIGAVYASEVGCHIDWSKGQGTMMRILCIPTRWSGAFLRDRAGSTTMEYALIAALISVAVLLVIFGDIAASLTNMFNGVVSGLNH